MTTAPHAMANARMNFTVEYLKAGVTEFREETTDFGRWKIKANMWNTDAPAPPSK